MLDKLIRTVVSALFLVIAVALVLVGVWMMLMILQLIGL